MWLLYLEVLNKVIKMFFNRLVNENCLFIYRLVLGISIILLIVLEF